MAYLFCEPGAVPDIFFLVVVAALCQTDPFLASNPNSCIIDLPDMVAQTCPSLEDGAGVLSCPILLDAREIDLRDGCDEASRNGIWQP